jgi:hypothetical protein
MTLKSNSQIVLGLFTQDIGKLGVVTADKGTD